MISRRFAPFFLSIAIAALPAAGVCLCNTEEAEAGIPAGAKIKAPRLTTASYNQLLKADTAVSAAMKRDRTLEVAVASSANSDAIDSWMRRMQSDAAAMDAIKAAGMTPEGYFQTLVALLQANAIVDLQKEGKAVPPELTRIVPSENVAFVTQHGTEVHAWLKSTGAGPIRPNTIEDLYVAPAAPSAKSQDKEQAAQPAAMPAPAPAPAPKNP